jgi:DNA-binding transcriptional MocR family regulator
MMSWNTEKLVARTRDGGPLTGQQRALLESLERHLPGAFSIELPRGDMALWGQGIAGDDTDAWAARGLEHGVDVSPASRYWFGRGRVDGFRLGFVDSHCSAVPCARSVML